MAESGGRAALPLTRRYRSKRVLDLVVLAVGAPLWLPVLVACAIAVRLSSGRPILFRQERIGLAGRPFTMLKFRTMVDRAGGNAIFPDEAAITPVGRFLRRTSLDELPQLLNVTLGDMSLVGPRPALPYQVARLDSVQRVRLTVRPGITGLAQIRGRNRISWAARIEHDLEYLRTQSLPRDVWILWRTTRIAWHAEGISGHPADDPISRMQDEPASGLDSR